MPTAPAVAIDDEAYKAFPGPVLLLAGPGTGKTYQLAKRIQFLTADDMKVSRDEISVITFTREAAQSMRDKISQKDNEEYVAEDKRPNRILTMHSLGHAIIKENAAKLNLTPDFELIESDSLRRVLMADASFLLGFSASAASKALEDRAQARKDCSDQSQKIIQKYEEILHRSNAIDHDDQIILACKLLQDPATRAKWLPTTKHLLIDEYQDINEDQFRFIQLLTAGQNEGLFVVGDDDQSIYKFRGGSPHYIRKFHEHFGPDVKLLQLELSRRCLRNILDCANFLVATHDSERVPKANPTYYKKEVGQVIIHDCPSDDKEARIVCSIIKNDLDNATDFRKVFILALTKHYSKKIEDTLTAFRLNYEIQRGSTDSVDKFLSIQAWIERKHSNVQLRRAIQLLVDGGSTGVPGPKSKTAAKKSARLDALTKIATLWESVLNGTGTLEQAFESNASSDPFFESLRKKLSVLSEGYQNDLGSFLKHMVDYIKPWATKDGFYKDITEFLKSSRTKPGGRYQIRILSLQASKGLEADLVFVVGLEEGSIPRGSTPAEVAEDARLIFVAMTRAKEQLHLTHCRKRDASATYKKVSHGLKSSSFVNGLPHDRHTKQYHKAK